MFVVALPRTALRLFEVIQFERLGVLDPVIAGLTRNLFPDFDNASPKSVTQKNQSSRAELTCTV
jgi:hypothetical protein